MAARVGKKHARPFFSRGFLSRSPAYDFSGPNCPWKVLFLMIKVVKMILCCVAIGESYALHGRGG